MKTSRLLILAFLLLTTGVVLICGYTHGNAGFNFSTNIPDTKFHLDLTTTGWPVVFGLPCVLFGLFFLCLAFLSAIAKEIIVRRNRSVEPASSDPFPPPA